MAHRTSTMSGDQTSPAVAMLAGGCIALVSVAVALYWAGGMHADRAGSSRKDASSRGRSRSRAAGARDVERELGRFASQHRSRRQNACKTCPTLALCRTAPVGALQRTASVERVNPEAGQACSRKACLHRHSRAGSYRHAHGWTQNSPKLLSTTATAAATGTRRRPASRCACARRTSELLRAMQRPSAKKFSPAAA